MNLSQLRSLSILSLFIGPFTFAQFGPPEDPYRPAPEEAVLQFGPNAGQAVPTGRSRPVKVLREADLWERHNITPVVPGPGEDYLTISNFRHRKTHYIARVPLHALERIVIQFIDRSVGEPHVHIQERYQLKAGFAVELFDSSNRRNNELEPRQPTYLVRDIVPTTEAARPPRAQFRGRAAMQGHYGSVDVFASLEEKSAEMRGTRKSSVAQGIRTETRVTKDILQFKLLLTPDEGAQLLRFAAKESEQNQYKFPYHPVTRSCLPTILRRYWKVLYGKAYATPKFLWSFSVEFGLGQLRELGLLARGNAAVLPSYNDEVGMPRGNFRVTKKVQTVAAGMMCLTKVLGLTRKSLPPRKI